MYNTAFMDPCLGYFGSIMVREGPDVDPSKNYMFGWAPHGILGICRAASGGSAWNKLYPEVYPRWGSFGAAFYMPGIREFSFMVSCVDAGKKTLMQLDSSINLIPGGIREMSLTDADSNVTQLVLKDRMGFIALAKEKGMPIIPSLCFGEKWATKKFTVRPEWLRRFLMRNQLSGVGFIGKYFTLLPINEKSIGWVFGEPIDTVQDTVEELHVKFLKSLENIFEKYKKIFEYADDETIEFVSVKVTEKKKSD